MKKTIIAGAASVVLAAMPVVGAFAAANEVEDSLTVNIDEACTIERTEGTGSYSDKLNLNTYVAEFGKTTLTVICNGSKGYTVNSSMKGLTGPAKATEGNEMISYTETAFTEGGKGQWAASAINTIAGQAQDAKQVPTSGTLMSNNTMTSETGDKSVITYSVSTAANQANGTYSGTATYTLSVTK